jgi:hypothetical protein
MSARIGYETREYKTLATLLHQMWPAAEKTIANCRKSAHATMMFEQHHTVMRRFVGLPA